MNNRQKPVLVRITTISASLKGLLRDQLRFMNKHFYVIGVSGKDEMLDDVAEREGIEVKGIEMKRQISILNDLIALLRLICFFIRIRPDIVHTHTPKAGLLGMVAAKLTFVKIRMHTVAGMPLMETRGFKRKLLVLTEKITYRNATMIYPNSIGLKDYIIKHRLCQESKIKVIGKGSSNGINLNFYNPGNMNEKIRQSLIKEYKLNPKAYRFITIGRIVKDKGINELIDAFSKLSKESLDVELLILGRYDSGLNPINESTRNELINNPKIHHLGYQPDIRPFLYISNVLVHPSYREGLPNVVMQACALGIPAIVSGIIGNTDIITQDENGIIIPEKDYLALYKAMFNIMDDKKLWLKLSKKARESVRKYDQDYVWNCILEEYVYQIEKETSIA